MAFLFAEITGSLICNSFLRAIRKFDWLWELLYFFYIL